jgi:outer membrane protein assembly factor BamD
LTGPVCTDSLRPGVASLHSIRHDDRRPRADQRREGPSALTGPAFARQASNSARKTPQLVGIVAALLCGLLLGLNSGCSSKTATFEDVKPADELYAEGLATLEGRRVLWLFTLINYDKAIESFQAIIDNYPYSDFEVKAQLKIADAYFDDQRYEEALAYYQDFADLHPLHQSVAYALLRAALCHYNQIESIERDQGSTNKATAALERLIREHPYAQETREGEEMMVDLRTRLALNMLHIADFYLDRTHWQSAAARYRRVLDEFPGLGLDARALYRLGVCLENMRLEDEALRLFHVVVENYSDSAAARRARSRIARAE